MLAWVTNLSTSPDLYIEFSTDHNLTILSLFNLQEGVMDCTSKFGLDGVSGSITASLLTACDEQADSETTSTVLRAIKYFQDSVEIMRMSIISDSYKEQLTYCLDSIIERTQDFTDSAYTTHEHRQNIIILCERAKIELSYVLSSIYNPIQSNNHHHGQVKSHIFSKEIFWLPDTF